jgi:molybdopterin-guanine dinucleotide biosynthesis protein B
VALGVKIPIFQVVGYQNSGKTTLISKLVKRLSSEGFSVGTIKHHGHGGMPEYGDGGKDSEVHRLAGASVIAVEGGGSLQLTAQHLSWDLHKTLSLYETFHLDAILIEGYKMESYPKIVLLRNHDDLELLDKLSNINCLISLFTLSLVEQGDIASFLRTEEEAYMTYILQQIRGHSNEQ